MPTNTMRINYIDCDLFATKRPNYGHTATGYGHNMPTQWMALYNAKAYRVKCNCVGNSGSFFIVVKGKVLHLRNYNFRKCKPECIKWTTNKS